MKKLNILLAALSLSLVLNPSLARAAEEIDIENTESIQEKLDYDQTKLNDLLVDLPDDLVIEEDISEIEAETYLDQNSDKLKLVYYDDTDLDSLLDKYQIQTRELEISSPEKPTGKIKDGMVYENVGGKDYKASNKWVNIGEKIYYADAEGKAQKGLTNIDGHDYYFGKDHQLLLDQDLILDGGKYQADSKGRLALSQKAQPGWMGLGDKSYYFTNDGKLARGLYDLGDARYYFDKFDGLMIRNQIINDGIEKIHTASNGVAQYLGWDYYNGKLSYVNDDGSLAKGIKRINGMDYGFDENGKIFNRQYKKFANQWYYFNKYGEASLSNGNFKTGWVGDRYYFADGKPAEGIQTIDGKTYIFHELSLEKQRNVEKVFNHKRYRTDANGVASLVGHVNQTPAQPGTKGQFRPGFSQYLNRKTPYFTQNDPRWKNWSYASGNYGSYACGPTAMAMVLNRKLNRNDIYPTTTAIDARPYMSWNGTDWQYLIEGAENYGFKSYEVPVNEKAFIQALKKNPIIIRVGRGHFINNGHYMVIDSYRDGKFYINDPFYSQRNTLEAHSFWRLKQEVTVAWEIN